MRMHLHYFFNILSSSISQIFFLSYDDFTSKQFLDKTFRLGPQRLPIIKRLITFGLNGHRKLTTLFFDKYNVLLGPFLNSF